MGDATSKFPSMHSWAQRGDDGSFDTGVLRLQSLPREPQQARRYAKSGIMSVPAAAPQTPSSCRSTSEER